MTIFAYFGEFTGYTLSSRNPTAHRIPRIMKSCLALLVPIIANLLAVSAHADLVLSLSGNPGSNLVEYSATGSITVDQATPSFDGNLFGRAPVSGLWDSSFNQSIGDALRDEMNTGLNDDLVLGNGGVSFRRNGVEFGVLQVIDLDGSDFSGQDDIELDPTTPIDYPSLNVGDEISWVGSGTFHLEDGETFDTLFIPGSYQKAIDNEFYVVNVAVAAVPEPTFCFPLVTGIALIALRRKCRTKGCNGGRELNSLKW